MNAYVKPMSFFYTLLSQVRCSLGLPFLLQLTETSFLVSFTPKLYVDLYYWLSLSFYSCSISPMCFIIIMVDSLLICDRQTR